MIRLPVFSRRLRALSIGCVALLAPGAAAGETVIPVDINGFGAADTQAAPRVSVMPYSEDFESMSVGRLDGQSGWYGQAGAKVLPEGIEQQSVVHRAQSTIGGTFLAMSSPGFDAGFTRLDLDMLIGSEESTYFLETVSDPSFLVNTRLRFHLDGTIDALQSIGHTPTFVDTGATWTSGATMRIGVEVGADGALRVYQDDALIFTGHDIAGVEGADPTGIGRFSIVGNYLNTEDFVMIDNVLVPTPGGIALAVIGVFFAIGRKRVV